MTHHAVHQPRPDHHRPRGRSIARRPGPGTVDDMDTTTAPAPTEDADPAPVRLVVHRDGQPVAWADAVAAVYAGDADPDAYRVTVEAVP